MNWIIQGAAMLAAATLAFGAQGSDPNFRGKFSLPYEVHWGQVVLPAGEYTVVRDEVSRPQVMYIRTHGAMYMILAGATTDFSGSGSRLELKNIDGMRFVTKLEVAPAGDRALVDATHGQWLRAVERSRAWAGGELAR